MVCFGSSSCVGCSIALPFCYLVSEGKCQELRVLQEHVIRLFCRLATSLDIMEVLTLLSFKTILYVQYR